MDFSSPYVMHPTIDSVFSHRLRQHREEHALVLASLNERVILLIRDDPCNPDLFGRFRIAFDRHILLALFELLRASNRFCSYD